MALQSRRVLREESNVPRPTTLTWRRRVDARLVITTWVALWTGESVAVASNPGAPATDAIEVSECQSVIAADAEPGKLEPFDSWE